MANPTVDIAHGCTVTAGTSSWTSELLDLSFSGISRGAIDTSHQGTTSAQTHEPTGLYDPGSMTMSVHFDPTQPLPVGLVPETWTITFPDTQGWDFSGFCIDYNWTAPHEDKMTAELTIKVSGLIDIDSSS